MRAAALVIAARAGRVACRQRKPSQPARLRRRRQGFSFPQDTSNDSAQCRRRPAAAAGGRASSPRRGSSSPPALTLRANSHDQVEDAWRLDLGRPRGAAAPRSPCAGSTTMLTRRAGSRSTPASSSSAGARADIVKPTDRFAPRDFLNVVDTRVLPVTGRAASLQAGERDVRGGVGAALHAEPAAAARSALDARSAGRADRPTSAAISRAVPQFGGRWRHTGSRGGVFALIFRRVQPPAGIDVRPSAPVPPAVIARAAISADPTVTAARRRSR